MLLYHYLFLFIFPLFVLFTMFTIFTLQYMEHSLVSYTALMGFGVSFQTTKLILAFWPTLVKSQFKQDYFFGRKNSRDPELLCKNIRDTEKTVGFKYFAAKSVVISVGIRFITTIYLFITTLCRD